VKRARRAPASSRGRRRAAWELACLALLLALLLARAPAAQERRWVVAFANLTEEPGVTLEGTGFTGREVREGFALAARQWPIELVFYDNRRDPRQALVNATDAIGRRVDLYIQYHADAPTNAEVGRRLRSAGIPVLAINHPVLDAPLYTVDNLGAGRIAGEALADFGARAWRGHGVVGVVIGHLSDAEDRVPERAQGVTEGLRRRLPALRVVSLDTRGNHATVGALVGRLLAAEPRSKLLIAALDDTTALAAKTALEAAGRLADGAIVGHGVDRTVHGSMSERKELDPANRGSIVLGSVAFYLDRYGYDVLPLVMRMMRGEPVPPRTATPHKLVTAANVFVEYPPYDMQ
jgi:ribose transport system substrate-binding protein